MSSASKWFELYLVDSNTGLILSLLLSTFLLLILLISWRNVKRRLVESEGQKEILEGEEHRMFEFLHTLGIALEKDHSPGKLNREIVDGVTRVVEADGGALYLLDPTHEFLLPRCISDACPLMIGLPVEVFEHSGGEPQTMKSLVRLSKVPVDEGMLGAVLNVGAPELVIDVKNHNAFKDAFLQYRGDVCAMVAPLRYGGRDLGVLAVGREHVEGYFSKSEFELFRSAAEQAAFALGNAMIHQEASEKRKIESELRTAQDVQNVLLPSGRPDIRGYRLVGINRPARIISGDYYDYIPLENGRWAVVIADVSGKGVAAGLLMAMCRSVLRAELLREGDPLEAVTRLNRLIFTDIREDAFISLALYILDENSSKVQLVRAGHDKAPLLRKGAGAVEWLKPPGLAIGLDEGSVFERISQLYEFEMEVGDSLLIYTDGVTEAENVKEEEFGFERLVNVMLQAAALGAERIVEDMLKALDEFVGEAQQADDITMIALEKC